jgi:phage tail protein X
MSGYVEHVTVDGERWDQLAWRYYADADQTAPIIRANRLLFDDGFGPFPAVLPGGLTLRIPILDPDPVPEALLPPWRRSAA